MIVAVVLIIGILSLGSGMFGGWINDARGSGILPVTLHSLGEADYGVDEITRSVPVIGLEIIQDLLGIEEPPETGGVPGIALITPNEPTLTPTSTLNINEEIPWTATPTTRGVSSPTATSSPRSAPTPTPTPFPAVQASLTPTLTTRPPNTQLPTSTPGISSTNTPVPTQKPPTATAPMPATNTPLPSPLPQPTNTPNPSPTPQPVEPTTARPTRSSTLAVTPPAQYTPVVPAGTPSLP